MTGPTIITSHILHLGRQTKHLAIAILFAFIVAPLAMAAPAMAQCAPVAGTPDGSLWRVADSTGQAKLWRAAAVADGRLAPGIVELAFLGHATFLIRSPAGVTAVTDHNDYIKPPVLPDIVTMNNAHSTHFTDRPDPAIRHVLRGWETGGVAEHDLIYEDMRVRNIATNVREYGGTRYGGNSIFVFEVAGLCIAHLGHLHHRLHEEHLRQLGTIDVLLVPVDGSFTLSQDLMTEVIEQISPSLVIPMHIFSQATLARFLGYLEGRWTIAHSDTPALMLSRATLPYRQVLVLPGH